MRNHAASTKEAVINDLAYLTAIARVAASALYNADAEPNPVNLAASAAAVIDKLADELDVTAARLETIK